MSAWLMKDTVERITVGNDTLQIVCKLRPMDQDAVTTDVDGALAQSTTPSASGDRHSRRTQSGGTICTNVRVSMLQLPEATSLSSLARHNCRLSVSTISRS